MVQFDPDWNHLSDIWWIGPEPGPEPGPEAPWTPVGLIWTTLKSLKVQNKQSR